MILDWLYRLIHFRQRLVQYLDCSCESQMVPVETNAIVIGLQYAAFETGK